MDDVKVEKTPTSTHTTINRTETPPSGGSSLLWFLVGGLVVAVVVVGYFVMGDKIPAADSSAGGNVSVTVDTAPAPAAETTPEPTPETAPAEVAPEPALPEE